LDATGRIATALAKTTVTVDGHPAPLLYVSATQIGAIVPYSISSSQPRVVVTYNGLASPAASVTAAPAAPALFTIDSSGSGQAAALNQDGSLNGPFNPAGKGEVITVFGTGEGNTNPGGIDGQIATAGNPRPLLAVSAAVGGVPASVLYAAAAPGQVAGMFQVNFRVPSEAPPGLAVTVTVTVGANTSPKGVTVALQ
ncbi:MAG: hypothetical protein M3Z09_03525, partial [Acidobacteriota bacterium]|nr:hypothetical protein [Acidobacteriota bacterium]